MGKMTEEKKKRRQKRLALQKQIEPAYNAIGKLVSVLEQNDPEFKQAAAKFRAAVNKYPNLNEAPQEELKELAESITPINNIAGKMAAFLTKQKDEVFEI